jgi:serine/threonine-protein kinase
MFHVTQKSTELEEANAALDSLYQEEEYDSEDEEEEFPEESRKDAQINPKMEKAITVGAIVATALIAIIIIVAIVSIVGSMKTTPATTTEAVTDTEEPQAYAMIDVLGYTEERAVELLEEAGIPYVIERDYSDSFEEGTVMSQSIDEGVELAEGDKVTIVISKGVEQVEVPDVTGRQRDEASVLLTTAGFQVDVDEEYSEEVEQDYVIRQSPEGLTTAGKGTEVTLVVSKGKEIKRTTIPNLKKKTVSEAETALSEANLKLGNVTQEYSDSVKEGKVISQSPSAGDEVDEGTAVDITISKGKKPSPKYVATFEGQIANSSYTFEESSSVYVTLTLTVNGAVYNLISDYYSAGSFPLDCSNLSQSDLSSDEGVSLTYSVKDELGNDVTGNFASSVQAKLKEME